MSDDVLGWIEDQLAEQRRVNAAGFARADALAQLQRLAADEYAQRRVTYMAASDNWAGARTEEQRARRDALIDIAFPSKETP